MAGLAAILSVGLLVGCGTGPSTGDLAATGPEGSPSPVTTGGASPVPTSSSLSTATDDQGPVAGSPTLPGALVETAASRFVVDAEGGTYAFTSADRKLECMFSAVDRPDASVNGFPGGCSHHHPEEGDGPTVFMVTGPGRPGTFAQLREEYPGQWHSGHAALEPGQFIDLGGQVACFSSAANQIGCLEYDTGQGYQLIGRQFHPFGPEWVGEVFDVGNGTMQLLSRRVAFILANGEELPCRIRAGILACKGGRWESVTPQDRGTDILWFDAIGDAHAPTGAFPSSPQDESPIRAQRVGPGRYLMGGIRVENTGTRLVFTRQDGSTFWVSPDDASGTPLIDPARRDTSEFPETYSLL